MTKSRNLGKLLAALLCLLLLMLAGCGEKPVENTEGRSELSPDLLSKQPESSVKVYYQAMDSEALVPLVYGINSSRDTIWIALEKLLAGPPDSFCQGVLPAGVKMKELYFADGLVHINLTGDAALTADDVNLAAFAATVNDELLDQDDTTAGLMMYYNEQPLSEEPYYAAVLNDFGGGEDGSVVYFADVQAMYLVPLTLPVNEAKYADTEKYLQALMQAWAGDAPPNSGVYPAVADGVKLQAVSFADGKLTLDFNQALLQMGGTAQESMFLDSLMATLAGVEQVKKLVITLDGQPAEMLPHGTDISGEIAVQHGGFAFNTVSQ
ncbi:MAG: GerMN domain-containing protein [Firmicutes bacterium]|nr:GerMN domain-containing protein [Bacillota bacterium]